MAISPSTPSAPSSRDERLFAIDLQPPTVVPTLCASGSLTGNCTLIEEADEQDCTLSRVCVPAPIGSDAERIEITYCGVTREFDLA
ncbi:MAG: hypothetical protein NTV51_15830, partial [Verrucomicrobia bacterium]|nr:hypothetical protein [Verrucomicrobiota bacterium]